MTGPLHRGVMGAILPGLEGEGITRKLRVHDLPKHFSPKFLCIKMLEENLNFF
jgi:hypothetical protein